MWINKIVKTVLTAWIIVTWAQANDVATHVKEYCKNIFLDIWENWKEIELKDWKWEFFIWERKFVLRLVDDILVTKIAETDSAVWYNKIDILWNNTCMPWKQIKEEKALLKHPSLMNI